MRGPPFWRRYERLLGRDRAADVEDELETHLALRVEDLVRQGLSLSAARAQAERELGDVARIRRVMNEIGRRRHRRERCAGWWESFRQDVRVAMRALRRAPGFAFVAVLTLAFGIGASTAVFSVVNGVLLQPLRYDDAESLVVVWPEMVTNVRTAEWLAENTRSLSRISGLSAADLALTGDGEAERVYGARVFPGYFEVLGARSLLGRTFRPEESEPGRSNVAVVSHALWQTRYGGAGDVVGRRMWIDYVPYTIVGVMPADHRPLEARYDVWIPQEVEPGTTVATDGTWWVSTRIARLPDGVSVEAAQAELRAAAVRLARLYPDDLDATRADLATVVPLQEALVGTFGRTLWILLGAVALVLLVACANVANLLLARAGVKQRDVAVRTALGSSRGRVVSHLLTESFVLGLAGGATGMALAWAVLRVLKAVAPADLRRMLEVGIDGVVLSFAVAMSLLTPLLFGLVPAYRATGLELRDVLGGGARGTARDGRRSRLTSGLIAAQAAVSVVLVIGAGLMARTMRSLMTVDPGFRAEGVLSMQVAVPPAGASAEAGTPGPNMATYRRLWDELAGLPGVEAVGGIHILPLASGNNRYPYWAEDNLPLAGSPAPAANIRVATPGYLEAMGIALEDGRWFTPADRAETRPVIVLNQSLAGRLWPGGSAVGKQVRLLAEDAFAWEVVGVIADVNQMALARDPSGEIYLPHEQWSWPSMYVTVRTAARPQAIAGVVTQTIRDLDPGITIARLATMEQVVAASVASNRFLAGLIGAFGFLALALSAVGVYGVVAYGVARRSPEFAVRMALGSSGRDVLAGAMMQGLAPVAFGVVLGVAAAWAAMRLLSGLLFGVAPTDPLIYGVVAVVLATVAAAASWLPARRALRVDPLMAVRSE